MINIVHFADAHIGIENYGRINPVTGLNSRLEDFLSALDYIINYSIDNNVDLVIFAGDAFKTQNPNSTQQQAFANRIQRLNKANIATVLLIGNHDQSNRKGEAQALDIYDTLEVENVYVGNKPVVIQIKTKSGKIQVATLPHISASALLTKEQYQSKTGNEIKNIIISKIEGMINYFIAQLKPDMISLLTAHLAIDEATTGSELELMIGKGFTVPLSIIARKEFNYIALGHIHKHQILSSNPPVVYPGSIERVDFGEEKDPKGFVHISLDKKECNYNFIPIKTRPFFTIKLDLREIEEPMDVLLKKINNEKLEDSIVRLQYTIESERLELLKESQIWAALAPSSFAILRPIIIHENTRTRLPTLNERVSSKPLEALDQYLRWNPAYKENVDNLLEKTRFLLKELKSN